MITPKGGNFKLKQVLPITLWASLKGKREEFAPFGRAFVFMEANIKSQKLFPLVKMGKKHSDIPTHKYCLFHT